MSTITKKEIEDDISRFKAIKALGDQEGGKILIAALESDIRSNIDTITTLAGEDEMKIRIAIVSLKKNLELLNTLKKAESLLDIAMDALKNVEGDE